MKMNKNKLANLLKTGILFFGISLLLWNCTTESGPIENNQSYLLEKLQSNFESKNFKEALPYDFLVNWGNSLKQYSQELETSYYEFPLSYTTNFNPDEIQKTSSQKRKYSKSYKLLVTENEKQEHTYYILRFYEENLEGITNSDKRFIGSHNFTGFIHLLDSYGNIVFAKKLDKGIEDPKKFYNKEFKELRKKDENLFAKVDETCVTVTTYHYTDWYNVDDEGNVYFIKTKYEGFTTEDVCETYWLPDLFTPGGGGTGTYTNNGGDGGVYNDCNGPKCSYEIEDKEISDTEIFNEELTGKAECLNDHLDKKGNSFIKDILKNFEGDSEFDIKIVSKDKVYKGTEEVNGLTRYTPGNKTIFIDISTNKISNRPALSAARTLIHEYIHADMFRKLYTKSGENNLDFKNTYEKFENGNFKSSSQHETMADLYVNSIRDALKSFHKNVLIGDYNYLTNNGANPLSDNFYEALAWQGLKESGVKAYTDLPNSKKTELTNALNTHYHSTTKNCPN